MARRKPISQEALLNNLHRMMNALNKAEPLPCAVIRAAFVEYAFVRLLHNFLIKNSSTADQIFNESKALGTFNACAEMAYCLGLVSETTFQNAVTIAFVRNQFAHRHDAPDFSDPVIEQLCKRAKAYKVRRRPEPIWGSVEQSPRQLGSPPPA